MAKTAPYNKLAPLGELVNTQPGQAVAPLRELARLYPSDPQVMYALGLAYLNTGQHRDAITQLENAVKRDKQNQDHLYQALAQAYSAVGMLAHAYRAASRAGIVQKPWQEVITDGIPAGAKLADLLEFEQARAVSLSGQVGSAIKQLQGFLKKFPDYLPAHNVLATAFYIQGQFDEARAEIGKVLQADPRNIHALLNLARVERLTGGVAAVEALRPQVEAARSESEGDHVVMGGAIALANVYQLMEDREAAERVIDAYLEADEDEEETPEVAQVLDRLARGNEFPEAPQVLPSELLPPGWFERWRSLTDKRTKAAIFEDLRRIPGWFEKLEEHLLYEENPTLASLFVALLLDIDQHTLPGQVSADEYTERLLARLAQGKGSLQSILAVTGLLKQLGRMPEGAVVCGPDGEPLQHLELELTDEPLDTLENRADLKQYEQALVSIRKGQYEQALSGLEKLREKYPQHVSIQFNIASVLARTGDEQQAFAMIEDIRQQFPHYLFAPAQLAVKALHDGDVARAKELLRFPEGLKKLHVQEYGFFMAATVGVALREGDIEMARKTISMLLPLLDEDDSPMKLLRQEVAHYLRSGGEGAAELLVMLMQ